MRFFRGFTSLWWGSGTTYIRDEVYPYDSIKTIADNFGRTIRNSTDAIETYFHSNGSY